MTLFTEFVNRQQGDAVIFVTGVYNVGKSTFLQTAAQQDLELVQLVVEDVNICPEYLVSIPLPDSRKLHLLEMRGPPSHEPYIIPLGESFVGSVILVDRDRPEDFRAVKSIWEGVHYRHRPSIIAANLKTEATDSTWSLEDLCLAFKFDADCPLVACNTKSYQDCIDTITALLSVCASTPFVEGLRTSFAQR